MGKLYYGHVDQIVAMPDDELNHLQVVIGAKLRMREAFFVSWTEDARGVNGRSSIWVSAAIPLMFAYDRSRPTATSRERLDRMMAAANTAGGLDLEQLREPDGVRPLSAGA